jgi:CheY-like chemotaxis protein
MMTVLIADDDPVSLRLLERQLEGAGYVVIKATSGREAFEILTRQAVSMVVTDWAMPEMDGLELCRRLRASESLEWIYAIVLTAHPSASSSISRGRPKRSCARTPSCAS